MKKYELVLYYGSGNGLVNPKEKVLADSLIITPLLFDHIPHKRFSFGLLSKIKLTE